MAGKADLVDGLLDAPGAGSLIDKNGQQFSQRGFRVEIDGRFVPINSYSGGDLTGEKAEASSAAAADDASTSGHGYISELSITAYVTPDCKVLTDAYQRVANQGQNARFRIAVYQRQRGLGGYVVSVYEDCLLTSYDFPTCDAQGGEILVETATFLPTAKTSTYVPNPNKPIGKAIDGGKTLDGGTKLDGGAKLDGAIDTTA